MFVTIKQILYIACLSFCLFSCEKKATYRIEGELSNLEDSVLYAVFEGNNIKSIDTILCGENGTFKIEKDQPASFDIVSLFFNNKTRWVTIYLEPKKLIKITGNVLYPESIHVSGGKTNDNLTTFKQGIKALLEEKEDLLKKQQEDDSLHIENGDPGVKLTNINHQIEEEAIKYIRKNPSELASAVLIQTYFSNPDDTRKMDELLALLSPQLKETSLSKELEQFSAIVKRTAIGAEAPDFSVKDVLGKELNLALFKDRYLLLSFAAPWCDICKTENVYLKEIRKIFPKEKLDMLTITLDEDQQGVRTNAKTDSISWHLVSDSAGYASMMIDTYGIGAIPKNFLIDNDGKIILKTENSAEVQQTLEKLIE